MDLYWLTTNIGRQLSNNKDPEGLPYLRATLQLALLISPLYLLLPIQLHKKTYHRQSLLAISELLGNRKPASIVAAEMAIWKTLFTLADGLVEPVHLLRELSMELGQMRASREDQVWFNLGKLIVFKKFENCTMTLLIRSE